MAKEYNLMPKIDRSDLEKEKKYRVVFLPLCSSGDLLQMRAFILLENRVNLRYGVYH
jgi:hypothetical protein